jgi:hypothetical protein
MVLQQLLKEVPFGMKILWHAAWKLEYWKLGNGFAKRVSTETNLCRRFRINGQESTSWGNRIEEIWREP